MLKIANGAMYDECEKIEVEKIQSFPVEKFHPTN
jgi:hypothetical protein